MSQIINDAQTKGFIGLTCDRDMESSALEGNTSTHDFAETMLYSFVDNSPHVADLLWSKQQLGQNEFLTLVASNTDYDNDIETNDSTHEMIFK